MAGTDVLYIELYGSLEKSGDGWRYGSSRLLRLGEGLS